MPRGHFSSRPARWEGSWPGPEKNGFKPRSHVRGAGSHGTHDGSQTLRARVEFELRRAELSRARAETTRPFSCTVSQGSTRKPHLWHGAKGAPFRVCFISGCCARHLARSHRVQEPRPAPQPDPSLPPGTCRHPDPRGRPAPPSRESQGLPSRERRGK